MDNVTNKFNGITQLRQFNLEILTGEVMGLLPLNDHGIESLLLTLQRNMPLLFGRIYCNEKLVNSHVFRQQLTNPVSVIEKRSHLVEGLTIADNVFILNQTNQNWVVHPNRLRQQLKRLERTVGAEIPQSCPVENLSFYQRCMVELMKAAVSGSKLVVLRDLSHFMTGAELRKLQHAIRYFAGTGIAFLYICNNWDEAAEICDRVALMYDGTITKVIRNQDFEKLCAEELIRQIAGVTPDNAHHFSLQCEICFRAEKLCTDVFRNLSFEVHQGECLVLHSDSQYFLDGLRGVITGEEPIRSGGLYIDGKLIRKPLIRSKRVAYIAENPAESMLFPDLSSLENLTFGLMDQAQVRWNRKNVYQNLKMEFAQKIAPIFEKDLSELSIYDQYDLAFYRVMLQRPRIVFCEQPFFGNDIYLRSHVVDLVHKLLEQQIAVVILVLGLYDVFPLSDCDLEYRSGELKKWFSEKPEVT